MPDTQADSLADSLIRALADSRTRNTTLSTAVYKDSANLFQLAVLTWLKVRMPDEPYITSNRQAWLYDYLTEVRMITARSGFMITLMRCA
jgi:hypothetical protein